MYLHSILLAPVKHEGVGRKIVTGGFSISYLSLDYKKDQRSAVYTFKTPPNLP